MSNLFASLRTSADALRTFAQGLEVTQNNVANAGTPGFARQRQILQARPFDPNAGLPGGVTTAEVTSLRDEFSEQAVRRQVESLGRFEQLAASLAPLELGFDVSGQSGIPGAMNRLFASFSSWSVNPNDGDARAAVVQAAENLAASFQQTSSTLAKASSDTDLQLRGTVDQVNALAENLQQYNMQRRGGAATEAGLDASIHSTLEQLSELADVSILKQEDGSVTVLLAGQTPLVVGSNVYKIKVDFTAPDDPPPVYPGGPPSVRLRDYSGNVITSDVTQGKLGALLEVRNTVLPALRGDAWQPGELNRLAKGVADRVNQILTEGQINNGSVPDPGVPLFVYDDTNDTTVATTLRVDPYITPDQLAAIDPGPPYVSNGAALKLAALASPQQDLDRIDGVSFAEFYGALAGQIGNRIADARENQSLARDLVAQARALRQESSGVSLDEEAINIIEFQRSYQAAAKMISVLDELTQTVVNLL